MDNGELNEEQAYILSEVVDRGRSICINGPGGTGKTFLRCVSLSACQWPVRRPVWPHSYWASLQFVNCAV